ncbi:UNVERIFIED_CONTAM: N-terminal acetyltransferase [Siphonaria sp. JEL0065]|nr:N-terminal acetyltransferase [Siphonaria sp. JEL0065]
MIATTNLFRTESFPPLSSHQLNEYLSLIELPSASATESTANLKPSLLLLNSILIGQSKKTPFVRAITPGQLSIDPEDVFTRLVQERRGGYCFHLNILLVRVLKALGFEVSNGVSRGAKWDASMNQYSFIGPTHMVVFVSLDEKQYLADLGFNHVGLTKAIEIKEGAKATSVAGEEHRIRSCNLTAENAWILWHKRAPWAKPATEGIDEDGYTPLLYFTLEKFRPQDYHVLNFFTSHSADFILARNFVASIVTETGGRAVVTDTVFRRREALENKHLECVVSLETVEELVDKMRQEFAVELKPHEIEAARARFYSS